MLYAVVANIMLRFYNQDSFQLRFWYKLFSQLHEYLGKVGEPAASLKDRLILDLEGVRSVQDAERHKPRPRSSRELALATLHAFT